FDLNGGSLIYRYDPKMVPIHIGDHYRIGCFVKTTVLPHARARLAAFFTDQDGNTIDNATVHSDLYAATTYGEPWHELSIEVATLNKSAAFLAVQLELLQPSYYSPSTLGERTLFEED